MSAEKAQKDTTTNSSENPENGGGPSAVSGAAPDAGNEQGGDATGSVSREAELEAELAEAKDQKLRALADAENTRRRAQREVEDARKYAVGSFVREMLPVADNLRRALEAVPAGARETDEALKALVVGIEATERQLLGAMERFGVKPVETEGQVFDPNLHQVMFEVESADHAPGTIVQVMQTGYMIHDRLLRPAMVGTAKAPASGGEQSPGGSVDTHT